MKSSISGTMLVLGFLEDGLTIKCMETGEIYRYHTQTNMAYSGNYGYIVEKWSNFIYPGLFNPANRVK